MIWTGTELHEIVGGILHTGRTQKCSGVSTDTRNLREGDLFVALEGDQFNGHDFVEAAISNGCCGCIVNSKFTNALPGLVHLEVEDTLAALGRLAKSHLASLDVPVVAVTGSNGKTGTKELIATALGAYGNVAKNPGNHNNLIGLPLAALTVDASHDYVVLEMGMNAPGEIATLAEIASPTVGVVTSVAEAHLEGVGTIEEVAHAKGELYRALQKDSVAVVNARDSWVVSASVGTDARVVTVGDAGADVTCLSVRRKGVAGLTATISVNGTSHTLRMRGLGRHQIWNAALAIGVVSALGLDPEPAIAALEHYSGVPGRLNWQVTTSGINIIDDSYNANPASARAALQTLAELGAGVRTVAVMGDMLELGSEAEKLHTEVGAFAASLDIDAFHVVGDFAKDYAAGFGARTVIGNSCSDIAFALARSLKRGDWVLVKGSRGARMERAVTALLKQEVC